MADSITEGTLTTWHKGTIHIFNPLKILNIPPAIGEFVERDEQIATIETDKVFTLP